MEYFHNRLERVDLPWNTNRHKTECIPLIDLCQFRKVHHIRRLHLAKRIKVDLLLLYFELHDAYLISSSSSCTRESLCPIALNNTRPYFINYIIFPDCYGGYDKATMVLAICPHTVSFNAPPFESWNRYQGGRIK